MKSVKEQVSYPIVGGGLYSQKCYDKVSEITVQVLVPCLHASKDIWNTVYMNTFNRVVIGDRIRITIKLCARKWNSP